jgi:glucokinase
VRLVTERTPPRLPYAARPVNNGGVSDRPRQPIIGVDVGGTKVAAAAIDGPHAAHLIESPTDLRHSEALIDGIVAAIEHVAAGEQPAAVGIGVPSQIDYASGTVMSSVNIPLQGVPLREELGKRLGGVPVFVDNDANAAALAEANTAGVSHLVMYTLGTGVGGGIVIDGRIYRGATGLGAELGHVVIRADGPECPGNCPNRGCLEALCSGTALGRDARVLARDRRDSPLGRRAVENGDVSGRDVVELARQNDPDSLILLERFAENLGVGIANAVNAFEPQLIVIGGGLSQACDLFLDRAVAEAGSRALPELWKRVRVGAAGAGPSAGVIGAGLLAAQEIERNVDTADVTASERVR